MDILRLSAGTVSISHISRECLVRTLKLEVENVVNDPLGQLVSHLDRLHHVHQLPKRDDCSCV